MTTASPAARLPDGFIIDIAPGVRRTEGGRTLVGGSPIRVVRLSARAQELFHGDRLVVASPAAAVLARRLLDSNLAVPTLTGFHTDPRDLTVVVPVRGRAQQLERCLTSLRGLRVVVVDDASDNRREIADIVTRQGAQLVRLDTNVGPAGARNAGLAEVTTPLVAFVDSDVTVTAQDLLDLGRHTVDPSVSLVGPRVVGALPADLTRRPRWFERYDRDVSSLDVGPTPSLVRPATTVGWLPSACLVGRVDRLGPGFARELRVGEDVDLVWRLVDQGHCVRYDPTIKAQHDVRTSARAWLGRKFVYGTGGAALSQRHSDHIAPAVLTPSLAIGAAAVLARRSWSLPVAATTVLALACRLTRVLPGGRRRTHLAVRLSVQAASWAVYQESTLVLRHWWPLTALALPFSRVARRATMSAILVDLALRLHRRRGKDLLVDVVAGRLDDMAYGAGLWYGALRDRRLGPLAVRFVSPTARRRGWTTPPPTD